MNVIHRRARTRSLGVQVLSDGRVLTLCGRYIDPDRTSKMGATCWTCCRAMTSERTRRQQRL